MERAVALVATHLGVVDEDQINNMSWIFFEAILEELGHKLNYEAVINYAGNSFVSDSWNMIQDMNPMLVGEGKHMSSKQKNDMIAFFSNAKIVEKGSADIPRPKGVKEHAKT